MLKKFSNNFLCCKYRIANNNDKSNKLYKATFNKFEYKNILFYTRRRSRATESLQNPNVIVDEVTYFKQMKEFMKETQGVPRNSQKWFELRNKHYKILREIYASKDQDNFTEAQNASYVRFYLVLIPESTDCYELVSILNYNNIVYKAVTINLMN